MKLHPLNETCATCRFSVDHTRRDDVITRCHRRAPASGEPGLDGRVRLPWPEVDPGWWCGEYERDEAKIARASKPSLRDVEEAWGAEGGAL